MARSRVAEVPSKKCPPHLKCEGFIARQVLPDGLKDLAPVTLLERAVPERL